MRILLRIDFDFLSAAYHTIWDRILALRVYCFATGGWFERSSSFLFRVFSKNSRSVQLIQLQEAHQLV